jgi:hypothetical protein
MGLIEFQISFADIMLFEAFETGLSQDATVLDKFPKIKACRAKVQTNKKMQDYLSKRKPSPM